MNRASISAVACLVAMNVVMPASAAGLGSLFGGGGGGSGSSSGGLAGVLNNVVTVSSGTASNTGLVNLGTGSSGGGLQLNVGGSTAPIADVTIGGTSSGLNVSADVGSVVTADVNVGGSSVVGADVGLLNNAVTAAVDVGSSSSSSNTGGGLLNANVNVGNAVTANVGVGTGGGLITANVSTPTLNLPVISLPTTPTTPSNPTNPPLISVNVGNPTTPTNTPSLNNLPILRVTVTGPGTVTTTVVPPTAVAALPDEEITQLPTAVSVGGAVTASACAADRPDQLSGMLNATQISGAWASASNVMVQRVSMCPETREWLQAELQNSGIGRALANATAADVLISASLSRADFSTDRVFAVKKNGSSLIVYVY